MPVEANSSHGLAVLLIVGLAHVANAQVRGNYRATLAEINEKTQEVSTEPARRILADGNTIVLNSRKGSEYVASKVLRPKFVIVGLTLLSECTESALLHARRPDCPVESNHRDASSLSLCQCKSAP